jgi:TonB-linked SusC/RagA family outer membrane protein
MMNDLLKITPKRILFSTVMASALLAGSPQSVFADANEVHTMLQSVTVKGQVVDANGEPIIGASVMVKGNSSNGTITNIDGNFSLNDASGSILVISYIGYKTQEIAVNGRTSLKIILQESTETLDEVVVVGYGTQKKETLTGSIAVVDSKMFESKGALSSPLQAMQGAVPGVMITRSSGAPGEEGWTMKLRGGVSKNSTEPLIIVDGVEISDGLNGLRNLNSSDIETMNFLKDASAAIYGSKAAGGVVLITTKRAKAGKTKVSYSGSVTGKKIGLQPTLMTLDEWTNAVIAARSNDGLGDTDVWIRYAKLAQQYKGMYIDNDKSTNPMPNFPVADYVFLENDWQELLWGNSWSTQHELTVTGGGEKSSYRLSVGYMHDDSALRWGNNSNDRYNIRFNNSLKLTDKLSLESVLAYSRQYQVTPSMIGKVLSQQVPQPGLPSASINGRPYAWGDWKSPNWLAELGGDNKLQVSVLNISEKLSYQINSDFSAVVQFGFNDNRAVRDVQEKPIDWYNYAGTRVVWSEPTQANSKYTKAFANTDYYMISGYLNWSKSIAKKHNLTAMAGAQYNYTRNERTQLSAKDIKSSLEIPNGSGEITIDTKDNATIKWEEALMSYFGRLNYDFQQRYLVEANMRYDGSSKFISENRWDFFWGVSGGWRISEEAFMQPLSSVISNLKLKVSYGVLGNQSGIDRYDGVQLYNFTPSGGALIDGEKVSYINTNNKIASTNRQWERIHNYNIALEFGFFDNKLTGTVDVFKKKNNNMLIEAQYPGILGDKAPTMNMGKFEAHGVEGTIGWTDKIGSVKYNIGGVITYATNELVDLGTTSVISSGYNQFPQGYPINSIFGLRYMGKIQTEEELTKYKDYYYQNNGIGMPDGLRLGDNMFEDVNGDGVLDHKDYVYLGSDDPKISFSWNVGVEWNNFDLSAMFQGVAKRTIFREGPQFRIPMSAIYLNTTNQSVGNTWSPDHRDAYYPSYSNTSVINNYNYQASSWSVENGSYVRLKNLTLGYSLPKALLAKLKGIERARIYFAGADLWETSKIRDGWDPEQTRKVDGLRRYPFNRTYTIGVDVTF